MYLSYKKDALQRFSYKGMMNIIINGMRIFENKDTSTISSKIKIFN